MPDADPRIYLVSPVLSEAAGFSPLLREALAGGGVASLLLRFSAPDDVAAARIAADIAPLAQSRGVAVILAEKPGLVQATGADGAHVSGVGPALEAAIKRLAPDHIVGAGALATRHEAMIAGEAGADYLLFGEPGETEPLAAREERVAWWAELFTTPCVAFAKDISEISRLIRAGADFVMLGDLVWRDPRGAGVAMEGARRLIAEAS